MAENAIPRHFVTRVPVRVRTCRASDLPALEWYGTFQEHRGLIARTFAAAESGEQVMWVAESSGFPAGQLWVDLQRGRLWAARVIQPLQGCGIGTRLLEVAEQDLRSRGYARAHVAVESDDPRALRFWMHAGYRAVAHTRENWGYDGLDGRWVDVVSDLYILRKDLARQEHARYTMDHR